MTSDTDNVHVAEIIFCNTVGQGILEMLLLLNLINLLMEANEKVIC